MVLMMISVRFRWMECLCLFSMVIWVVECLLMIWVILVRVLFMVCMGVLSGFMVWLVVGVLVNLFWVRWLRMLLKLMW